MRIYEAFRPCVSKWINMKLIILALCATSVLTIPTSSERKRYDGYKVLEIHAIDKTQYEFVSSLKSDVELDFWYEAKVLGQSFHVMVPPHRLQEIYSRLDKNSIDYNIVRENVQERIDAEQERLAQRKTGNSFQYFEYQDFDSIMTELENIAARCPEPFNCYTYVTGYSVEGREIKTLKIEGPGEEKQGVWLDATMHAREWLSGATLLNIANRLASDYNTDTEVQLLLDTYDWYISPITNPDGYVYTWVVDRMWRKNRSLNDGASCLGVDLNRNFDYIWGGDGASGDPCSNLYYGPAASSEPEVESLQNEMSRLAALGSGLAFTITFHCYGQMWLMPYSHMEEGVCVRADDHEELYRVIDVTADATEAVWGTQWSRGTFCEDLYSGSGVQMDWALAVAGIPYSYLPELRGDYFDPPPSEIEPSYYELWGGLVAMVNGIQNP